MMGKPFPPVVNRIDQHFLKTSGKRKTFVAYLVAGDPDLQTTPELVWTLEEAGADIIELGVPFSDPLADGVVNQLGAQRALEAGATLGGLLDAVRTIRTRSQVPLVLFTYYNPIFHYGVERFLDQAGDAGVDGILMLDLPPEEAAREWPESSPLKRISLIAPTTPPERIRTISAASSGFIYYVSREGVTGMQTSVAVGIEDRIGMIRTATDLPVCVGFGVSNPEQAAAVAGFADGVVVGSAIVDCIGKHGKSPGLPRHLHDLVAPLTAAVHNS